MRKIILGIVITFCLLNIAIVSAQGPWQTTGNTIGASNFLGTTNGQALRIRTNNTQRMTILDGGSGVNTGFIGIGNNFNAPSAVLHINAVNNGTGETFRTTSNATGANNFNAWRMFVGAGNGTEKFAILNPVGSDNIHIRASRSDANIQFQITSTVGNTLSPITRMVITDGPFFAGT